MTLQQAIEKAIEGGWNHYDMVEKDSSVKLDWHDAIFTESNEGYYPPREEKDLYKYTLNYSEILLDPLFWQALGKSMGWQEKGEFNFEEGRLAPMNDWVSHWHRLIDHLAEGKDIESYFEEL